jgi:peptide/nickel transport system permease protein
VLPGDPAKAGIKDPRLDPARVEAIQERFGLDKPVLINLEDGPWWDSQFFLYLGALAQGDLGLSYSYKNRTVSELLGESLVNTLWLVLPAEVIAIVLGVALGLVAAWRRGTRIDLSALTFGLVTWSLPTFFLGIILLFFGSRYLRRGLRAAPRPVRPVRACGSPSRTSTGPLGRAPARDR